MRIVLVLAMAVFQMALASCASDPDTPAGGRSPAATAERSSGSPEESPAAPTEEEVTLEVWFSNGTRLHVVHRELPGTTAVGRAAVEALLQGPTEDELDDGISTAIPEGSRLLDLDIADGTATVDLSAEYESGGGSASVLGRLAQVVFTLTQFETVDEVAFRLEGEEVQTFSSEGVVLNGPQGRDDFEDQAPAIIVTTPRAGATVPATVTVAGTANVFEATVSIKIVSSDGEVLAETFTTATCGTGCRGDFSIDVPVDVTSTTSATVRVFESSAEDGRPTNVVKVPVTISP
ncbi:MAG: Gmad2 immunoglobulin-like domain-containing protein [Actinomycetota bacterium]